MIYILLDNRQWINSNYIINLIWWVYILFLLLLEIDFYCSVIYSNWPLCGFHVFLLCCQALELMNNWATEPLAHQARWLLALQSPYRISEVRRCQTLHLRGHNVLLCDPVKGTAHIHLCRESDWTKIDSIVIHFSFTLQVIALLFFILSFSW